MITRLVSAFLVVGIVFAYGCSREENFPTAGAPGSTQKMAPDSPPAKYLEAAKKAGRMGARPGRN